MNSTSSMSGGIIVAANFAAMVEGSRNMNMNDTCF